MTKFCRYNHWVVSFSQYHKKKKFMVEFTVESRFSFWFFGWIVECFRAVVTNIPIFSGSFHQGNFLSCLTVHLA